MNSRPHDPKPKGEPALASEPKLALDGLVARARAFSADELARLPRAAQIEDVEPLVPGRKGRAVRLSALLEAAGVDARARFVDVSSLDPNFAVSESLESLRGALVVYALDGAPLAREKGGPFRLLVPGHADECVHVKGLARLTLAAARGRDTRPVDDAEHAKLHAKRKA